MITIQLQLDDTLAVDLQRLDPAAPLHVLIPRRLTQLRAAPLKGKVVMLSQADCEALEAILGGGSVLNGKDLVQKVSRLAGISFEHIRLQFTPGQLDEVVRKADSSGITVDQLIERMAPRIMEQFFGLVPV